MLNPLNNVIKVYQKNFTEFEFSIGFLRSGTSVCDEGF